MELHTIADSSKTIYRRTYELLVNWGVPAAQVNWVNLCVLIVLSLIALCVVGFIVRKLLLNLMISFAKKSVTKFDDYLVANKAMTYAARLVPLIMAAQLMPTVFSDFPAWIPPVGKFLDVLVVLGWVWLFRAVFRSVRDFLRTKKGFEDKPLDSYLQVANIFMFFVAGIIIFSMITGQSPWAFIGALGAASAILLLVFKDMIMGFVASIQVSTNDMVRVGDWIEMPKYNADGDVLEINLNTVKIRNWDKTITTVPTHYLVTDSFKNWRGMHSAGGRRIKRSISLKISSIRYLEQSEIDELKRVQLLTDYIRERQTEIDRYNAESGADSSMPVNGRKMTNAGLYRQYINRYTEQHPLIHKGYTMVVRQLQPTEFGLPIELYMYTSNTKWAIYENAMADIFDHLLASVKYFGLEVFEVPASDDIRQLGFGRSTPANEKRVGVQIRQGEM